MDRTVYNNMRATERDHWWFRARREILADQLSQLGLPGHARILEVGCGTGGNLEMLARFGSVVAVEPDEESRSYAAERTGFTVLGGTLPDGLPDFDGPFDVIAALDVIEHLEADGPSVAALRALLKPRGVLLTTVPANPWMWSRHDELHHHKRRYRKDDYLRMLRDAGFRMRKATYFNSALYPAIAAARFIKFGERSGRPDDALPPRILNALLETVFAAEKHVLRRASLPFGVSLLVVAEASA